ncbi:hypothetical protein AQULUS_09770 [Aquicella lusitana]|uniref:Drug/metabolite transporter (DMT)-like permease n=2 Tax=Aquicella lusitana TaxID=254246 RepID=A0A370GZT2_9COXI|nr:drug/metabolite transporter (DMT)-like permease [Aquicella lusitana]VVC73245.1 hypothetical protein AQULUS_09770 [Aquicella lusitana]
MHDNEPLFMQKSSLSRPLLGLFLLILLGFNWGTGFSIARFATTNGVPPVGYSFWQSLGPAITIGSIALLRARSLKLNFSRAGFYFICGLTGIVIPNTTMYLAAPHLPAGIVAMIVNIVPIVAYPMALLAGLETFNWQRIGGILFALCGLVLIILPASSLPSAGMVPWALSTLITPVSFAACSIFVSRYRPADCDSLDLAAGMLAFSSLLLTPMVFFTHSFYGFHFPFTSPDWIVLLEIILSSIGYILYFQLIKVAGPVYFSMVDTIVVLTGLMWGYFIFGEHLNQWTASSVLMIVFALLLVTQQQRAATLSAIDAAHENNA